MSECIGEGCPDKSHGEIKTEQSVEAPPQEAPKPVEKVKAPDWCVFTAGETFPLRGFNFECIGYTKNFEVVLKAVGITGKEAKRRGFLRRGK